MSNKEVAEMFDDQVKLGLELLELRKLGWKLLPKWYRDLALRVLKSRVLSGRVRVGSYTVMSLEEVRKTPYWQITYRWEVYEEVLREYLKSKLFVDADDPVYRVYSAIKKLKEELYRRNINLIYTVMRRMRVRTEDWDEVFSACSFALLRAIDGWDPTKGALSTYAYQWIVSAIQDYYEKQAKTYAFSYNAPISEGEEDTFEIFLSTEDTSQERVDLEALLSKLPKQEREIIKLKFFHNYREKEIADILGLPFSFVHSAIKRALAKLRKLILVETPQEVLAAC
ncbi:MAG: sigma-70 family RNA polymerase sigma factor [Thermocrinis sp.]|jgi:RNA polymerase sigma factor (sigma-70 family)|uniref:sigma-70 family RNA polymerase sigma factor n=1 Tax=Thermocrinis sp. TaxID=2024383 RepID=UPI003C0AEE8C